MPKSQPGRAKSAPPRFVDIRSFLRRAPVHVRAQPTQDTRGKYKQHIREVPNKVRINSESSPDKLRINSE
eukprot:5580933-Pyramimonas_sp.AAC.1